MNDEDFGDEWDGGHTGVVVRLRVQEFTLNMTIATRVMTPLLQHVPTRPSVQWPRQISIRQKVLGPAPQTGHRLLYAHFAGQVAR
jgi:hypothetical protein